MTDPERPISIYLAALVHKAGGRVEISDSEIATAKTLTVDVEPSKGGFAFVTRSPAKEPKASENSRNRR